MTKFIPQDPDFVARVRADFQKQQIMALVNASIDNIQPGFVQLQMPYDERLTQQHGYLHAGIIATLADSAGGYAAFSLMPAAAAAVLSIEFKINMMRPAIGERLIARGQVVRAGRQITVCSVEVDTVQSDDIKTCAVMQMTLMTVFDRPAR